MNCIREQWHLDDFDCNRKKKCDESAEGISSDQHSWFGEMGGVLFQKHGTGSFRLWTFVINEVDNTVL